MSKKITKESNYGCPFNHLITIKFEYLGKIETGVLFFDIEANNKIWLLHDVTMLESTGTSLRVGKPIAHKYSTLVVDAILPTRRTWKLGLNYLKITNVVAQEPFKTGKKNVTKAFEMTSKRKSAEIVEPIHQTISESDFNIAQKIIGLETEVDVLKRELTQTKNKLEITESNLIYDTAILEGQIARWKNIAESQRIECEKRNDFFEANWLRKFEIFLKRTFTREIILEKEIKFKHKECFICQERDWKVLNYDKFQMPKFIRTSEGDKTIHIDMERVICDKCKSQLDSDIVPDKKSKHNNISELTCD